LSRDFLAVSRDDSKLIVVEYSRFVAPKFTVQYYSIYESLDEVFRWDSLLFSSELFVEHCCPHEKFNSDSCTCVTPEIDVQLLLEKNGRSIADIFSNEVLPIPPYEALYGNAELWNNLIGFGRLNCSWTTDAYEDSRFVTTLFPPTFTTVSYCRFKGFTLKKPEADAFVAQIANSLLKDSSHSASNRRNRKEKMDLKRKVVHGIIRTVQTTVPTGSPSIGHNTNSSGYEEDGFFRNYRDKGQRDYSMPAALVGDHVSDNDLGFSSASGMSHSNEDMNENMLSDLPPLITFSPLELESSALNYHETLNKGTPEENARGNMQGFFSDGGNRTLSSYASAVVNPSSATCDNGDQKKLSKQERNRRNVRNFYKRRKAYVEELEKNNEMLKKECLQMREQLALLVEEVNLLKESRRQHSRTTLDL